MSFIRTLSDAAGKIFEVAVIGVFADNRGKEFVHRELDTAEEVAGVVIGTADAFLFRHTEVIARDNQLCVALQADDGELPQRTVYRSRATVQRQLFVKELLHGFGKLVQIAAAGRGRAICHFYAQADGVNRFYYGHGEIGLQRQLGFRGASGGIAGKDFGVSFAAEQDNPLVECGDAGYFRRYASAVVAIYRYAIVVSYVNGIEAAVEGYAFDVEIT